MFWVMVIVAVSFVFIAVAMTAMALFVSRALKTLTRLLEERVEPAIQKVTALSEQVTAQSKEIGELLGATTTHITTATMHLSESAALIKEEVRELKLLVGETAVTARDKVQMVSRSIDRTHDQVFTTTTFIRNKVLEPARELAAIMAGFRRGLEVLVAPAPKPINETYQDEELFIG